MRAVSVRAPGALSDLSVIHQSIPIIKADECLIKVAYTAVNRADILQRKGLYPPPPGESETLGLEVSGTITKPDEKNRWKIGDRVMCLLGGGGYAEYAKVNSGHLMRVPSNLSLKEAGAIPEVWLTAFQLIYFISDLRSRENDPSKLSYLVHAGASGVGTALIQLLNKVVGSEKIFVTIGSEDKKKYINEKLGIGENYLINYKNDDFQSRILTETNSRGVDFVFDCVGASYWQKNVDSLAVDGNWILYGTLSGGLVNGELLTKILRKRIQLRSSTLRTRSIEVRISK
jgi:tumor protein p53-inducible protein 3